MAESGFSLLAIHAGSFSMDIVHVRLAESADHEGILAINRNIFGGLDYLRFTFHKRLREPNSFPVVAELNHKVVGYTCSHVIGNGQTILMESARVLEQHRQKKVINEMHDCMVSAALRKFPNIKHMIWTSDQTPASLEGIAKHPYVRLINVVSRVSFDGDTDTLKAICETPRFLELFRRTRADDIQPIPQRQALKLLQGEIKVLPWAPEVLLVKFEPWTWDTSTLIELLNVANLHVSRCHKTGKLLAFSFGTAVNVERGLRYRVDFYCPADETGLKLAIPHMLYHIREFAMTQDSSDVSFSFIFSDKVDKAEAKAVLANQLGLRPKTTLEVDGLLVGCKLPQGFQTKSKI